MFARLIDWTMGLVFKAVAGRIAAEVSEWTGEEVEPLDVIDVKALPAPNKKGAK